MEYINSELMVNWKNLEWCQDRLVGYGICCQADDPSLIPQNHMVEGEKWFYKLSSHVQWRAINK